VNQEDVMAQSETPQKQKKVWWKRWWAIVLAAFLALSAIGALVPSDDKKSAASTTAAAPAATATVTTTVAAATPTTVTAPATSTEAPAEPAPTPQPKPSFEGDGQYVVREDIQPGTYRTREDATSCYWARLKGFGGDLGDIIANENATGPTIVTISRRDKGFEASGCPTFTQDLSRITGSKTRFGDGVYIVRTDITPGRYRSSGGDGCYWARLKGFGGGIGGVIANGNVTGRAVVTILPSDKGFQSSGCGDWRRG
jgi:hypothetical protein